MSVFPNVLRSAIFEMAERFCFCGRLAVALCDWEIRTAQEDVNCNAPVCEQHVKRVDSWRRALCPEHANSLAEERRKIVSPQGELFSA